MFDLPTLNNAGALVLFLVALAPLVAYGMERMAREIEVPDADAEVDELEEPHWEQPVFDWEKEGWK